MEIFLQSSSTPDSSVFIMKDSIVEFSISKSFNYNNKEIELCVD